MRQKIVSPKSGEELSQNDENLCGEMLTKAESFLANHKNLGKFSS
jgi:hypothetical protein